MSEKRGTPSILFLNRVYPPVAGATGTLLAELAEALSAKGWRVSVITTRPPHTSARDQERQGVVLFWVRSLPFTRAAHWKRALSYLSLYPSLWWRILRAPRHDITVMLTDPPLQFIFGPMLRVFKRTRLVHWAQDVYPEIAEQLGVIRPRGFLAGSLRRISTVALRRFDQIVAVGTCMKERLVARGVREDMIAVIPNWARPELIRPVAENQNPFRAEHQLSGRFVVMYSGNVGLAHTFDAMLEAAELLQRDHPHVLFLIVGEGPRLDWLGEETSTRKLANIRFLPSQPSSKLAESLSAAQLHLVTMREDLCGLVVPSKFYGILAAGRPVIFVGPRESEVAREIEREKIGTVLPGATGRQLVDAILSWVTAEQRLRDAGIRARAVAERNGLEHAAEIFDSLFRELLR